MKTLTLITAFICLTGFSLKAQNAVTKTKADSIWATQPKYFNGYYYELPDNYTPQELLKYKETQIKKYMNDEIYRRLLREWGILFWKRFPDDIRRFKWLALTRIYDPVYFSDIRQGAVASMQNQFIVPLDTIGKNEWRQQYSQYLKEVQMSEQAGDYLKREVSREFTGAVFFNERFRSSEKDRFDIGGFVTKVIAHAKEYGPDPGMLSVLYRDRKDFGLDDNDILKYIMLLKSSEFSEFHKVAKSIENMMNLERIPLQFSTKTIEGKPLDIKQYSGKLLLVDFWSLGCSVCIKKMPEIKGVYDGYKSKGFEVISVCVSGQIEKDTEKILQIHQKIGAEWPLTILDYQLGGDGRKIFDTYGWIGVPQLLLLDENGKLLNYGSELQGKGSLEKLVKQYLVNKSIKNQRKG